MTDIESLKVHIEALREHLELGRHLSDIEAQRLERIPNPDDKTRFMLIGYYQAQGNSSPKIDRHVLSLLERVDIADLLIQPADGYLDQAAFAASNKFWRSVLDQVEDATLLGRIAMYLSSADQALAAQFAFRATKNAPTVSTWHSIAGQLATPDSRKALVHYESALLFAESPVLTCNYLSEIAVIALTIGETKRARSAAVELLRRAPDTIGTYAYGNGVHIAHIVLGRLALSENSIETACAHLLSAGKAERSPQLSTFGPDFSLARELIMIGEMRCVVEFLDSCKTLWDRHSILEEWTRQIAAGERPTLDPIAERVKLMKQRRDRSQ